MLDVRNPTLLHYMITVILLKEFLLPVAQCPNRDEVSDRMLRCLLHIDHRLPMID